MLAQTFGEILQLRVVIDANVVIEQLIWRLTKRRDPSARTGLHEAIDSGVVIAFAPQFLKQEILEHISEIAEDANVPLTVALREWEQLQLQVHFYEPEPAKLLDPNCADPDDLPYKLVCEQLGAHAVYSRDPHLQKMNSPVISVQLDLTLRDYARATAVRLTIHLGTTYSVILGVASFIGFAKTCRTCMQAMTRLPIAVKIVITVVVLFAIAHPKSRAKLLNLLESMRGQFDDVKPLLGGWLLELATQSFAADKSANETGNRIRSAIPSGRRLPAIVGARAICLTSNKALTIQQIESRMRNDGYVSKSRNFGAYLTRLMRNDGRFAEVTFGRWTIKAEGLAATA